MIRVMHIDAGNMYGGVETFLVSLARYRSLCPEMDPEFAVCFEGRLASDLAKTGVWVHRLSEVRSRNPLSIYRARKRLGRLLARGRTDVVVCHMPWVQAMFGPVVRKHGLPLVCWLHGASEGKHWIERWASRTRPDLVFCNSNFSMRGVVGIFPRAKGRVLYYPVANEHENPDPGARAALRAEFATDADSTVIIQVSRLERWKGHTFHLDALAKLRDLPGWTCWIVGGPQRSDEVTYNSELKDKAIALGLADRIRFLGQRADVAKLLGAADIFCQPNTAPEPFGIVFVEAMFAQLPVVTTALGGAVEIVDERCGVAVEPGNVDALSSALRHLIVDEGARSRLGAAGKTRAEQLCGVESQMNRLFRELSSLAGVCSHDRSRSA
ncbi:MAG TPA: glycosyltransferase family 4 protein [Candidatus Binataceae bacterium]|nr:glycosyltransferase family 4 protein [Candidatus Binataceae bacterium]